ncbi:glycosyltransferase family 4 protein [Microvirga sp. SRT01]|uniref:Glycosyltransferase family 4 protein n=1 Tax=Sphingomonas longa TaxID=2778730 RepID=A0ABS2DBX8_9SPHN|nr:glycosyltransferase family 4 protein [Microvirga sp. SRT01]MBM6578449.1 glycosyltransferase family 4 protein [Sphingomonas sp. BT552]MBR7711489.1 glycosyltransferase family 4 protein [Microvirga sp. SRT01]
MSELYYPEQTSTGYFLTAIAEGLATSMAVNVVSGQPTYSERGILAPANEDRNGVRIHRARATHFNKDRLLLRAINTLTLTLSIGWFALIRFRRADQLLIVTNPPTLPPLLGLIARFKNMNTHLLVHDVYPEVLAATGIIHPHSITYRLLSRVFSATFRAYDSIIVLGRDMAELIQQKIGNVKRPITIIPNWGDPDEIKPIPRDTNPFLLINNIRARCIIQFSGNIGRTHDIETILAAAHNLRNRHDIIFLFVGYGGKASTVANAIASGELPNVRFLPRQPREMLGPMLASATATIISFVDEMKGLSVPSRMYNVMAAGTPIIAIADPDSELSLTVREEQSGWILAPGDVNALTELVTALAEAHGEYDATSRGINGREAVLAHYTFSSILTKFRRLLIVNTDHFVGRNSNQ